MRQDTCEILPHCIFWRRVGLLSLALLYRVGPCHAWPIRVIDSASEHALPVREHLLPNKVNDCTGKLARVKTSVREVWGSISGPVK